MTLIPFPWIHVVLLQWKLLLDGMVRRWKSLGRQHRGCCQDAFWIITTWAWSIFSWGIKFQWPRKNHIINLTKKICSIPCYIGPELDKGASQESGVFDWLLLGERSFGTSLWVHVSGQSFWSSVSYLYGKPIEYWFRHNQLCLPAEVPNPYWQHGCEIFATILFISSVHLNIGMRSDLMLWLWATSSYLKPHHLPTLCFLVYDFS